MADTTYADALAALRAECGAPTRERVSPTGNLRVTSWTAVASGADVSLYESGGAVWIELARPDALRAVIRWLAGEGTLTPLADAVRDAGAWLRGAR